MYERRRTLVSRVFLIFMAVIFLISGFLGLPGTGFQPVAIVSGSMLPTIKINAICVVHECDIADIEVGDILMYYHPKLNENVTHRCIERGPDWILTKGDSNDVADDIYVIQDNFRGKVVSIWNWAAPLMNTFVHDREFDTAAAINAIYFSATLLLFMAVFARYIWSRIYGLYMILGKRTRKLEEDLTRAEEMHQEMLRIAKLLDAREGDTASSIRAKIRALDTLKCHIREMNETRYLFGKLNIYIKNDKEI